MLRVSEEVSGAEIEWGVEAAEVRAAPLGLGEILVGVAGSRALPRPDIGLALWAGDCKRSNA